ncbi:hypothetical protein [Butyrivibrio sp. INlla21]|uniref:hypothetical protein n=1 Tax=Butyrivibrio sp. INlla21 TaxID=1520811 RepID=UPI0008EA8698|nr:hypothetical protein [Butyrivibrio sp. INlla21]SFV05001.1 hypothetical protein SAMN02910342_03245 [Butyrivibrio sp. INlla21]
MEIRYCEEKPDLETYYDLRAAVDFKNFCPEQSQKALDKRDYFVIAKDGFYKKLGFEALPDENAGPALRKLIYT